jgi:hypothetical protein
MPRGGHPPFPAVSLVVESLGTARSVNLSRNRSASKTCNRRTVSRHPSLKVFGPTASQRIDSVVGRLSILD